MAGCAIAGAGPTAKTARAQALEQPQGHVILTIRGSITRTNAHGAARFDRAMLQAMPQTVVETMTPWTDGITRFKGPLARDVMSRVGATGRAVKATAINDYAVEIPLSDFEAYPVILATQMNGEVLRTRTKGPVWVIYPWSDHADLRTEVIYGRSIWQLKEMVVVE
ncbi:MAG: molybdopterin-dependent oxidoreductase [Gammaproteobacteria bacterium]|nr:molybdopterin-dependent oxidoreductase [Gammaproteobacteria bacterium]NIR84308.1 molybdopterin-dependent oxidoreductase [Gammaproteobacteria bacterium]NIU04290.1 molybdopterin-dependent oxidoreductase [Gammaproteobacteria bacterium]NIV51579.1 molybdopterin-dependent oxidoreductase [Gammaproteobacteria bacterium]NIX85564.1 molybdopterin-dependent oxidoreductase [Gammaproteobacteria bacterium]